jgi:hypothetical protein
MQWRGGGGLIEYAIRLYVAHPSEPGMVSREGRASSATATSVKKRHLYSVLKQFGRGVTSSLLSLSLSHLALPPASRSGDGVGNARMR